MIPQAIVLQCVIMTCCLDVPRAQKERMCRGGRSAVCLLELAFANSTTIGV